MNWEQIENRVLEYEMEYERCANNVLNERAELKKEIEMTNAIAEATEIVNAVAKQLQQNAHTRIATIVTHCLQAVFEKNYEFKILFETKRNKTEAKLAFLWDGQTLDDPTNEAGLGVVDVAAFALRLASVLEARPAGRRLLVLDEPFKFVSEGYLENVRVMLEGLAERLGVQIIMVTHIRELMCGKIIEV